MSLSAIKWNYLDKIQNVDNRIDKYTEIIEDYDRILKRAENEGEHNISSVIKSKNQYEQRIKNMLHTKQYYQEFVDTSDYLMQNLNKEDSFRLLLKCEELEKMNDSLLTQNKDLENIIEDQKEQLKQQNIVNELDKIKLKKVRERNKNKIDKLTISNANELKKLREENKSLKKLKNEIKKLSAQNQMLEDTNDFLENKCLRLEEYCNELLNRRANNE